MPGEAVQNGLVFLAIKLFTFVGDFRHDVFIYISYNNSKLSDIIYPERRCECFQRWLLLQ